MGDWPLNAAVPAKIALRLSEIKGQKNTVLSKARCITGVYFQFSPGLNAFS